MKQKTATKSSPSKESVIIEVANGIKEYFNSILSTQLLYKFERLHHQTEVNNHPEDTPMSSIYGGIHLIRLFGKQIIIKNFIYKFFKIILKNYKLLKSVLKVKR